MLFEAFTAVLQLGLPVAVLTAIVLRPLYASQELDREQDAKTLNASLKALGKARKKNKQANANLIEAKWWQFGGGFYGAAALWTFVVLELNEVEIRGRYRYGPTYRAEVQFTDRGLEVTTVPLDSVAFRILERQQDPTVEFEVGKGLLGLRRIGQVFQDQPGQGPVTTSKIQNSIQWIRLLNPGPKSIDKTRRMSESQPTMPGEHSVRIVSRVSRLFILWLREIPITSFGSVKMMAGFTLEPVFGKNKCMATISHRAT